MKKSKTYIWSKKNLDNDDDELIKLTLASLTIYQIKKSCYILLFNFLIQSSMRKGFIQVQINLHTSTCGKKNLGLNWRDSTELI